jgi:hypothetical protein
LPVLAGTFPTGQHVHRMLKSTQIATVAPVQIVKIERGP